MKMTPQKLSNFREIWLVDFEFHAPDGESPRPICMCGVEFNTGRVLRLWVDEFGTDPPFPTGPDALFVAYYSSAELGCFLALDWPFPTFVLDLYAEFRAATNGLTLQTGRSLLGALAFFGLDPMEAIEKDAMRGLAIRGAPFSKEEQNALLDYCEEDVQALVKLLPAMAGGIDLPRALLRGRYMAACAQIERQGIPLDGPLLAQLRERWADIQDAIIQRIDRNFGVFEGRTFKQTKFAEYLHFNEIPWSRLPSGSLDLKATTFRDMAAMYPELAPLRELRTNLSDLRKISLTVGADNRNRFMCSAFGTKTGRNAPAASKSIFGPSAWIRGLIKPPQGHGLAYVDWGSQEFEIAAALSGDRAMLDAYESGDPYLVFASVAGEVDPAAVRDTYKTVALGLQYGMGERTLALRIGQPEYRSRTLIEAHKRAFPRFWSWIQSVMDTAALGGEVQTVFGWPLKVESEFNPRTFANFPMQSNGAEMLRLAAIFATEAGVAVDATLHDALLIEAPLDQLENQVAATRAAMDRASQLVLRGFTIRTDVKAICYPDRYADDRGGEMWKTVMGVLAERAASGSSPDSDRCPT